MHMCSCVYIYKMYMCSISLLCPRGERSYIYIYIIFFLCIIYIMHVLIGKEKCNQCNILKNLLDEKGIQYHYVDVSKIPHELLTYLRMYCNTYSIVLGVKYFSTFNKTLEYFKDV